MNTKVNSGGNSGEVKDAGTDNRNTKTPEPNQALQRTEWLVTDHAPRQATPSLNFNVRHLQNRAQSEVNRFKT